jgi:hypothetical protein
MFLLHGPSLRLSIHAAEDPFWSVLQFHLNASGAVEMGHSESLGLWAFPVANAVASALLPVIGEYLYLGVSGSGSAVFPGLTTGVSYPEGAYDAYANPLAFSATAEIRGRFRFAILYPMAMELVVFGTVSGTAQSMDLPGLAGPTYVVGAYLEHLGGIRYAISYRVDIGVSYDIQSGAFGLILALR